MSFHKLRRVACSLLIAVIIGSSISYAAPGDETVYYLLEDHLGNIDVVLDEEGNVVERRDYLPYGEERVEVSEESAPDTDYGFTGKEKDDETGLYYYGARYYDPVIGRFTSIDPWEGDLTDPQSLNKYTYARNNPIKYVDPDGQEFVTNIAATIAIKALDLIGYNITAEFLNYAVNWNQIVPFQGASDKKGLYFNTNSTDKFSRELGGEVRGTNEYRKILNVIQNKISSGTMNDDGSGSFSGTDNRDLYLSIHSFNYTYNAEETEDGSYDVTISMTDTYDFKWETPDSGIDIANNAALLSQITDAVQTFELQIDLHETIKLDEDKDESK